MEDDIVILFFTDAIDSRDHPVLNPIERHL